MLNLCLTVFVNFERILLSLCEVGRFLLLKFNYQNAHHSIDQLLLYYSMTIAMLTVRILVQYW